MHDLGGKWVRGPEEPNSSNVISHGVKFIGI